MPLLSFHCPDCGAEFEDIPPRHMGRIAPCPACGEIVAADEIAACTFALKGRGWASDGYASK